MAILFSLVGAERAYFGQKDAQQVMVIRQMARDLAIGTDVVTLPDRPRAGRAGAVVAQRPPLPGRARSRAGPAAGAARGAGGVRGRGALGRGAAGADAGGPREEPLAVVDYVSVADGLTLTELGTVDGPALASLAVRFGTTRLIDNEPLGPGTGTGAPNAV